MSWEYSFAPLTEEGKVHNDSEGEYISAPSWVHAAWSGASKPYGSVIRRTDENGKHEYQVKQCGWHESVQAAVDAAARFPKISANRDFLPASKKVR